MHLLRLRITASASFLALSIAMSFVVGNGCSPKAEKRQAFAATQEKATNWTDTVIGEWRLRLHGPGPVDQHRVWEGPVEIGGKPGVFFCKVDIELVDGFWVDSQTGRLFFSGYSGSSTYNYIVNIDSCSTVTKKVSAAGK